MNSDNSYVQTTPKNILSAQNTIPATQTATKCENGEKSTQSTQIIYEGKKNALSNFTQLLHKSIPY